MQLQAGLPVVTGIEKKSLSVSLEFTLSDRT